MKKITITIETVNAAFQEEEGCEDFELARILQDLANQIKEGYYPSTIKDINGNTCGDIEVE